MLLYLWLPVPWYACFQKNWYFIIASTWFCVSTGFPARSLGCLWTERSCRFTSGYNCFPWVCVQIRARPDCGRRIDRVLNAPELHFAGALDRHHTGGWILCVYIQYQAPDLSASLDCGLDGFRTSLSGAGIGPRYAVECV